MGQNYKLFYRDTPLHLCTAGTVPAGKEAIPLPSDLPGFLQGFDLKRFRNGCWLVADDTEAAMEQFRAQLKLVLAAGGVVWNRQGSLLMIFRRGRWDLPKGKMEPGESREISAIREVSEESGIGKMRLLHPFNTTWHIYKEGESWIFKETFWYEILSSDDADPKPQREEGIKEARWVPAAEARKLIDITYPSIRGLVEQALNAGYRPMAH